MGLFGNSGFQIPDLTGKVALVTGAKHVTLSAMCHNTDELHSTGIGYATAEQLAIHGAKVWMGARSEEKAKQAIAKFNTDHQNNTKKGEIVWLPLDLTFPVDVMASAKSFLAQVDRLDILVNNAARLSSEYSLTKDGIETLVAINHVGHFALTEALLPLLRQTAQLPGSDVRVVTVSSIMHNYVKVIKLDTKSDLNNTFSADPASNNAGIASAKRYNFSKLLNVLFASELQRRVDQEGISIISISLHPGVVATDGAMNLIPAFLRPGLKWFGKTREQGAASTLFAATSPEVRAKQDKYKGAYLGPGGKLGLASETGRDEKLGKSLWDLSHRVVKDVLEGKSEA
ncbi:related to light induced alcohol dehydrogenase Bli-4 [Rhynchosporium graminicola]|uniref:Related to light induced alcohol dehydrogenase Bli-4 n=1 Tax=Rhynchosporium graminicola TaxID=2792576 RepID=A0A1E1L881_9HELO|nr:related to light induced alcohol dehydrogenase Bli-4 [Rhynchosporium commune]